MKQNKPLILLLSLSYLFLGSIIFFASKLSLSISLPLSILCIYATTTFVTKRIANPLSELQQIAKNLSRGEFKNQFPWSESYEIAELVAAISDMATQLEDRFTTITNERNEKEAILSTMTDGVVLLDINERILSANHAGCRLLGFDSQDIKGLNFSELVRNSELQTAINTLLLNNTHPSFSTILSEFKQKTLQIQGIPLINYKNKTFGLLIMIHDLTPIKQLDAIRKDFVANVSHELKTPITLIKGALETIEEMDIPDPQMARFLEMAKTHTSRLNQILEDLLTLARLEQSKTMVTKEKIEVSLLFKDSIALCLPLLEEKKIQISAENITNPMLLCNIELTHQALINLIKNAAQYSETTKIELNIEENDEHITLVVTDFGKGIEKDHLPRLFERFYRVDKARTRASGGTGLGLALVKHILQVHNGTIEVQSEIGKGSVFKLRFPKE